MLKRKFRSSLLVLASDFQEQRPRRTMDLWAIILLFAFMVGIMGWGMNLFVNGVLWYCDWREGTEINWGLETFFTLAMPFTWLYTIFLIVVLYIR